ncbi:SDR family NAD(P)-dependent oxidoreductase [Timonella senegalensis]|uniref:SDR family NAD(P)-dependent oxidoreductase n=1 Tax=Timonella senegalensis TaxID=1465825 RepID=UPI00031E20EB|nr:SDR family oxidoreductase [Timonella senegalensis]
MKLENKVAIITGGAGGIGRGISLAMAKEGAKLAIVDINEEAGAKTLADVSEFTEAIFINKDISNQDNVKAIVAQTVEHFGHLDILVNNAHASRQVPFMEQTQEIMDLSFNTGFYPTFHFMQAAYPQLKANKGKVINFASGSGLTGKANQTSYAAAKEAIRAISRVAANEWGADGINVNLISPIALTEGVVAWSKARPEQYEQMVNGIPLRTLGDPESDIGRVAVFLASEDSDYITGQTIMVDGGSIMLR